MLPGDCVRFIVEKSTIGLWGRCRFVSRRWARLCAQIALEKYMISVDEFDDSQEVCCFIDNRARHFGTSYHAQMIKTLWPAIVTLDLRVDFIDIKPIERLPNLRKLTLSDPFMKDIPYFDNMQQLTQLRVLRGDYLSNVFGTVMPNLKKLHVINNTIHAVPNLKKLVKLIPNLQSLYVYEASHYVQKLTNLTSLRVDQIGNIPLNIPTLRNLSVKRFHIRDAIANLRQLQLHSLTLRSDDDINYYFTHCHLGTA
jgi:hypothetical protein